MKRLVQLFILISVLLTASACNFEYGTQKSKLTIPEEAKYLLIGVECVKKSFGVGGVEDKTYIYYLSENGELLEKELILQGSQVIAVSYFEDFIYLSLRNGRVQEINLVTGEIKELTYAYKEGSEVYYIKRVGELLYLNYYTYGFSHNKGEICVMSINDAAEEKCVGLDSSYYDIVYIEDSIYALSRYDTKIIEFDLDLNELNMTRFYEECYLEYYGDDIYIVYTDGIHDWSNKVKYDRDLTTGFYDYHIFDNELFLVTEQTITVYDIKNGEKKREVTLEPSYDLGHIFTNLGVEKFVTKFDNHYVTVIPFDLKTLELSPTKFVFEPNNDYWLASVYALYTRE